MKIDRKILSRYAELRLRAPGAATSLQQGDRRSPFLGRGLEFADYREYDPGDDVRLIDWNVYLRLGQVLVRQFHEERSLSIKLCVDISASMGFGAPLTKADRAGQLTSALATMALTHRDPVHVICFGGDAKPVRTKAVNLDGLGEILRTLERVEPSGTGDAGGQLAGQLGGARTDRLFLLSDMLCEPDQRERMLRLLAASSLHPVLVHLLDKDELEPDLRDVSKIVDAETGEELNLKDGASATAQYKESLASWLAEIESRCRKLGIHYLRPSPELPTEDWVQGPMQRANVVEHTAGGNQ